MRVTGPGVPPNDDELTGTAWHISSHSENGGGSCVEAGPLPDGSGRIALRHSHFRGESVIVYTREEWDAFLAGAKSGEFDF
ncbi:MAG TPA: DUF397 domain-containing protein [Pseudonocardiaceae bacterium]|jgi:hypothetical protein|nr:DUF397 domain-containing protein [Pseudonocardiaceae bacterium]